MPLATAAAADLALVGSDNAKQVLIQLGIEHEAGLVNQVDQATLTYANDRAAEMIGKKWVDGVLQDNPDAEWVITDSTRDEIQDLVSQVADGSLKLTDLPEAIRDAGAFSEQRAAMIARTEILTANAQGTLASLKAARDIGVKVKKAWICDDDPCPICQENEDAGPIDLDDDFPSGDDAPTAHPNCECVLTSEVDTDEDEDSEESDQEGD